MAKYGKVRFVEQDTGLIMARHRRPNLPPGPQEEVLQQAGQLQQDQHQSEENMFLKISKENQQKLY